MRIGIDIRPLLEKHVSGIPLYTRTLIEYLLRIDDTNEYLFFLNCFRKNTNIALSNFHKRGRVVHYAIPNKLLNISLRIGKVPLLDRLLGGVDVFVFPNLACAEVSVACKKIIVLHDLSFIFYPNRFSAKERWWHWAVNIRRWIKTSHHIITVSHRTKDDIIEQFSVDPKRISVLYPAVEQEWFSVRDEHLHSRLRSTHNLPSRFILGIGSENPRKNIEYSIRAFSYTKDSASFPHKLILFGASVPARKNIEKIARACGCIEDIRILGSVSEEEKRALFQLADAYIYPSFYEGFGFPPLEAMSASCPVIASYAGSLPEIMQTSALLIDPYNPQEAARAMSQILTDTRLRASLIQHGLQCVKRFSWDYTARMFLNILEKIVAADIKTKKSDEYWH